ncbi:TetR/AcrR family transcriptional regulator [Desertimonas flava]|jgi:AcrR family transcriptional regulator|uniref:TetR/AcrR family transcriptional regulator n=1 Tax=Desertimonas flava TaxID=2064846 RepID=UPI000E34854F|nr:TetR/AcrR family transcriptional regulator [Desertimonas flava]
MSNDAHPHDLPAVVRLLWDLGEPSRRGPKPTFTRDDVVAAAIEVADAEGITAVSMGRVAAQLGSSTMALYRYVASKDDLLTLMSDAAFGLPPEAPAGAGWRPRAEQWARAVRDEWTRRPWLLKLPVTGPPTGPRNLRWFDACLAAFDGTGLDAAQRVSATLLLSTYVRGERHLMIDISSRPPEELAQTLISYDVLAPLVSAEQYPALARMIADGEFDDDFGDDASGDDDFEFGLTAVLDGIAAAIERASA